VTVSKRGFTYPNALSAEAGKTLFHRNKKRNNLLPWV